MSDAVSIPMKDFAQSALARIATAEAYPTEERVNVLSSVLVDILKRIEDDASQDVAFD